MFDRELIQLQVTCTIFFQTYPYAIETAKNLALRLGNEIKNIVRVLQNLTALNILMIYEKDQQYLYGYRFPHVSHV